MSVAGGLIQRLFLILIITIHTFASANESTSSPITPQSIRNHHQALVELSNAPGGFDVGVRLNETGKQVAHYLKSGYEAAGIDNVRLEPFYPNRWWPEDYRLDVIDKANASEQPLTSFPVWYSEAAKNLELELVYVGYGTPGELRGIDVKGKAVLMDMKRLLHFVPMWHPQLTDSMNRVKDLGAAAVITAETRVDAPTGAIVGDAGAIVNGKAEAAELFALPVLSIGKTDGDLLKSRLEDDQVFVRMNLDYSLGPTTSWNVVAELPGNGKIDETILIGGHYDTWFTGAIDNLGSQAALLEMARYFASIPQHERDRDILFVSLYGHELNNHGMGHAQFVENYQSLLHKITCFLNVDGSGSWGWEEIGDTGEVVGTGREDKGGIISTSQALSALAFETIYQHYPEGPATWFQFPLNFFVSDTHENIGEAGIPALQMINKHIYYHSPLDTLDRIEPEHVYRRTLMNIDVAEKLMSSPAGYYINSNANPYRPGAGTSALSDISVDALPENPSPWQADAPSELDMHIIPSDIHVFSPVIAWAGFWSSDGITKPSDVGWRFDGLLDMWGEKTGFFSGTLYLFPGEKTVLMAVTDSLGRTSTVSREIEVRAGWFWILYIVSTVLLIFLVFVVVRSLRRKTARR